VPRLQHCRRNCSSTATPAPRSRNTRGRNWILIKLYEADMRHLLNTYIQADPAADFGNLNSLSLTEAIIETGSTMPSPEN
jgi:hypothetical protein